MKTTLAILMLLGLASAHAASIYLHDGEIVRVQRDGEEVYIPEQYDTCIDVAETDPHLAKLNGEWAAFAVVGTNVTYNGELVEWEAIPYVSPLAQYGAVIDAGWPLLVSHPSPDDIPEQGLTYRLFDSTNKTFWVVRRGDLISTQLSAHDGDGNEITRTRNLRTGEEKTIKLRNLSDSVADKETIKQLKKDLKAVRLDSTNTSANAQARQIKDLATVLLQFMKDSTP